MQFVFQLMMKLLIRVIHLQAVWVKGTSLLRESFRTFLKKIAKSSHTTVNLYMFFIVLLGQTLIVSIYS